MEYNLKKPCRECPFLAQMAGWIGSHKSAIEFHDVVQNDQRFACHLTHNKKEQHCAGYILYMNAICKLSNDPDTRDYQTKLSTYKVDNLLNSFDGSVIVQFHNQYK